MCPHICLLVVGDASCTKSELLHRLVKDPQPGTDISMPYVFEDCPTYSDYTIDGQAVTLSLFDSSGLEEFEAVRSMMYKGKDVILLCYNIECAESLRNAAQSWAPDIRRICGNKPIILVGCKPWSALAMAEAKPVQVSEADAEEVKARIKAESHIMCDINTGSNVPQVLEEAVRAALRSGGKQERRRDKRCSIQ